MTDSRPTTHQKALQINIDSAKYGTFAEIGAGQEVARWFFHVGGASGTVAKTMSAYDMVVSDAIYGHTDRYVSRQRLESMLGYEYDLLLERLKPERGQKCTFFVFADTMAARSYGRKEDGHGWMGIRFQTKPLGEPSEIIIHVNMLDKENVRQQEGVGVLGVNLIHAAFYHHPDPPLLISSLMDDLIRDRIELDMIKFSGPAFSGVDNRLMSLQLVQQGFTDAAMFTADGEVVQPSEVLYKKPILVQRGSFRPITKLTYDLLQRGREQFLEEPRLEGAEPLVLMEMTLRNLSSEGQIEHEDFLARVDILRELGQHVLISNYGRYFRLTEYLSRYTKMMIGIALGVPSLEELLDEKHYKDLEGGTLESVGRLFKHNVKVYVYPYRDPASKRVITAETMEVSPEAKHLYAHLLENRLIEGLRNHNPDYLPIFAKDVLAKLQSGDASWEQMVPPQVVRKIKEGGLFHCRVTAH
jgi:hypothetical protein